MASPNEGPDATEAGDRRTADAARFAELMDQIIDDRIDPALDPILDRLDRIERRLDAIEQGKQG